jgi:hypothetical protein
MCRFTSGQMMADNDRSPKNLGEIKLERVKGIEPSYSAWEAAALPLSYTRAVSGWCSIA